MKLGIVQSADFYTCSCFGAWYLLNASTSCRYQYSDIRLGRITRHIHNDLRLCYHRVSNPMVISRKTPPVEKVHVSETGIMSKHRHPGL